MSNKPKTNMFLAELKKSVERMKELAYQAAIIIYIHPDTLKQFNLSEFEDNVYFIEEPLLNQGDAMTINDESLKREVYNWCVNNPDKVVRGKKGII